MTRDARRIAGMTLDAARERATLSSRGVDLSYLDFGGDGPLVIVTHANGFCAAPYAPMIEHLRERFRVLAIDARGHGHSSAPPPPEPYRWEEFAADLVAFAEHALARTGRRRVAMIVGHSFGGTTALTATAARPDLFARVATLDPVVMLARDLLQPGDPLVVPENSVYMAEVARKRRAVWPSREAALAKWRTTPLFGDWDARALELYVREGMRDRADGQVELACHPEVEAAVFAAAGRFDLLPHTAKLRVPGLVLHATRGDFSLGIHRRIAESAGPHVEVETFEAGHLLAMTEPERTAERLLAFTERTASA